MGRRARLVLLAVALVGCRKPTKQSADAGKPDKSWSTTPIVPAAPAAVGEHPRILLSPTMLATLKTRALEKRPEWIALQAACDDFVKGTVEWPDGNDYPAPGNIGEGYQGEHYFHSLLNVALCSEIAKMVAPTKAAAYAKVGVDVLVKMSEPSGPHAPVPEHDDVYGIRFYGEGLALGYDWLYGALTPAQRTRIYDATNRWLEVYAKRGFGRDHPQGNYFAGYYAAKALNAIATKPENPKAEAQWSDFRDRLHGQMVQPYYARWMAGGGWPEGWNYGQLATVNMMLPALATQSATGSDLFHDPKLPYAFPRDQAENAIHFTWPNRKSLDDRGAMHPGTNPSAIHASFTVVVAGVNEMLGEPIAPVFHRFAREVRAAGAAKPELWQDMLFWNEKAPEKELSTLPRSFLAQGMQAAAMRSSWDKTAVWASFTAGPHVANAESGEMGFDQGGFAIVRGDRPFVVNVVAAMQRDPAGSAFGDKYEGKLYDDLFGNHDVNPALANRTVYNIFYVEAPHYGQIPNAEAATKMDVFDDGGSYVVARGIKLEEAYRTPNKGVRPVKSWTRQMVYLRPSIFVVDDRTVAHAAGANQWQAFHVEQAVVENKGATVGKRYDVGAGATFAGSVLSLLPKGAAIKVVDLYDAHRVHRLEVRPPDTSAEQRWLTVFDVSATSEEVAEPTLVNVTAGQALGVALQSKSGTYVVVSTKGETTYEVGAAGALHVVTDLPSGTKVTITVSLSGAKHVIKIALGSGTTRASSGGVLAFKVDASGAISAP